MARSGRDRRLEPRRWERSYVVLRGLREAMVQVSEGMSKVGKGRLVDYGCGDMPYRPLFEPRVEQYLGLDLADNPAADDVLRPDGGLPLGDGEADVVLSTQVLEHVDDPGFYLAEAHRVLTPEGQLVLSTHGLWWYHPHPQDLWRWTSDGLRREIERAGFVIEHFHGIMSAWSFGLQIWQDYTQLMMPRLLRPAYFFGIQQVIAAQERLVSEERRVRDAAIYLAVARKAP